MKIVNLDINPDAFDEIFDNFVNRFIYSLEMDIIPEIIEKIQLPSLPSRARIKEYDLKKRRIPKIGKEKYEERHPYRKSLFIQQIANLKQQLNGHKINQSTIPEIPEYIGNSSELYYDFESRLNIPVDLKGIFFQNLDLSKLFSKKIIPFDSFVLEKLSKKYKIKGINEDFIIKFENEVKREVLTNNIFMKFINQIEITLKNFSNKNNITFHCSVKFEEDFEIRDFKKLIVSIRTEDDDIQEKLTLWDQIDEYIRKDLENLANSLDKNSASRIYELNEKLFTDIILY